MVGLSVALPWSSILLQWAQEKQALWYRPEPLDIRSAE